ncbi:avidin family protein [Kordia periserrulae]|uniref:Avidin family protein n=1 Tax=Kordia periserrulae TaxID=701523 RepID=A0A2T6BR50_9FLAO|nr:avidin/streptavidin family protein [Kordia periserrulae]PTX58555.1 avidin family protein [Kordia periserrulae]
MKKILNLSVLILLFSISAWGQETNTKPTCENPIGAWKNDSGSTLAIDTLDTATGKITGTYTSPSGGGSSSYPLIGWVNDAIVDSEDLCKTCKTNNAKVISFTVRWGSIGSITSWTGKCQKNENGDPVIKTLWNLVRPNTNYDWDHILTGSDNFYPSSN